VNRGGSWNNDPINLRGANRNRNTPDNRNNNLGFRVVWPAAQHSPVPESGAGMRPERVGESPVLLPSAR